LAFMRVRPPVGREVGCLGPGRPGLAHERVKVRWRNEPPGSPRALAPHRRGGAAGRSRDARNIRPRGGEDRHLERHARRSPPLSPTRSARRARRAARRRAAARRALREVRRVPRPGGAPAVDELDMPAVSPLRRGSRPARRRRLLRPAGATGVTARVVARCLEARGALRVVDAVNPQPRRVDPEVPQHPGLVMAEAPQCD
jgi:hypothetical protein